MATKVEISKRLVLINSAGTFGTRLLSVSVFVWVQQYLLRRISPEEYSLLPILAAVMVFTPLVSIALTGGIARYVTEAYARGDERRVTQIVSTMFPLLLGTALLVLAGGWVFSWYVDSVVTIAPDRVWDARIMMALMVFTFAFRLSATPFRLGTYVRQRFVLQNAIEFGSQLVFLTVLFVLLYAGGTHVMWVVVSNAIMNLCDVLVLTTVSRRLVPSLRWKIREFRRDLVKPLTTFGGWTLVSHIAVMVRTAAAPLFLNKLTSAVEVTSFHVGSLADRQISAFVNRAFIPVQPALIAMHTTGQKERMAYTYMRIGRLAMWAALCVAVPLAVFGKEFFQLYLRETYSMYASAGVVMAILLAYYPLLYATGGLMRISIATAQIRPFALIEIAGQLANVGLMVYLVGYMQLGAIGAALSIFSTGVLTSLLGLWPLGLRMLGLGFNQFVRETLWPGLVPALVGVIACTGLRVLVRPSSWLEWAACCAFGMVIYCVTLLVFCLRPADSNDLRRILAKIGLAGSKGNSLCS